MNEISYKTVISDKQILLKQQGQFESLLLTGIAYLKRQADLHGLPFDMSGVTTHSFHQCAKSYLNNWRQELHLPDRYVIVMTYQVPAKLLNLKAFW